MNIKKQVNLLMLILAVVLMYSCNEEAILPSSDGHGQETSLSVLLNTPQERQLKSSGNTDANAESKIYSLEVLIFKSTGESEEGKLDGYGYVVHQTRDVVGQTYNKEYVEINEISKVKLTAGKRDVYVVANAPDKYFSAVANFQEFLSKYENLSTQGRYPHPGTVVSGTSDDLPIGGINPSDLKTNLTMCSYLKNVSFNNLYDQHYLGYTTNNGRPDGVASNHGWPLNGTNPFLLERLVARVAVQKIEFDLPASLPFEGSANPSNDYTFQIDSVFMMNVKTTSTFAVGTQPTFTEKFGHGSGTGFSFLNTTTRIGNLSQQSLQTDFLEEAITARNYDISTNATPLWFYAFENADANHPTYLVIGARYNFRSSVDNTIKTVKCYYPVIVNEPKTGKIADHDYIKRNYQYQIIAKIKGLGNMYGNNPTLLKSMQSTDSEIEITETVGLNLFPWTGDIYR